jgi:L-fuculose-phosphate aldolase
MKKKGVAVKTAGREGYIALDLREPKISAGAKPTSEYKMHLACYAARADINAVIHTHPPLSTAVASVRIDLNYLSYELVATLNSSVARIKYLKAGTKSLALAVASEIKRHNGVLLANHGLVTVGKTIEEALNRTLAVERACLNLLAQKILGKPKKISKADILKYLNI